MKSRAVRLHGESDLRLDEFELPAIKGDEVLVKVISDSICMSTYKEAKQGSRHIRVPEDIEEHPVIVGHEFCGQIVQVGERWKQDYQEGTTFVLQPGILGQMYAPGYSYEFFGGACTYCIVPSIAVEKGCLIQIESDNFFQLSVTEPLFCVIGGFNANLHSVENTHTPSYGVKGGGNLLIMGGCGPMGLGAIGYALALENPPRRLVVTEISDDRLERARLLMPESAAREKGIELHYLNTLKMDNQVQELMEISGGAGYDDVFIFAPIRQVAETGNALMAHGGCMNLFGGPTDKGFLAEVNLYDCHYRDTRILGSSGGLPCDFDEALDFICSKRVNPAFMITHVGGLNAYADTTLNLPGIPGGKKLIYTHIEMPLTAIEDFRSQQDKNPLFGQLADSCEQHNGLWNAQAEQLLLKHFGVI